jgi:hypothetical protein
MKRCLSICVSACLHKHYQKCTDNVSGNILIVWVLRVVDKNEMKTFNYTVIKQCYGLYYLLNIRGITQNIPSHKTVISISSSSPFTSDICPYLKSKS